EIAPRGIEMGAGPDGGSWVVKADRPRRGNEAHLAIAVDKSADEIMAIAREAGWPTARYDRGGFFQVVEVWVDGAFLIEFLDPAETAAYRRSMTPANWKTVFGVHAPAA